MYRHVHVYLALQPVLLEGWEAHVKPFEPRKTFSVEKNEEARKKHVESQKQALLERVDTVWLYRLVSKVFDFYALERKPEFAVAPSDARVLNLDLTHDKDKCPSVACEFLRSVTAFVEDDGDAPNHDQVSLRTPDGIFERHLIRAEALRSGVLYNEQFLGSLYYATPTLGLKSVLGPSQVCDHQNLLSQMRLGLQEKDELRRELEILLKSFALAGFNRYTQV